jgi:hypothetical protein
MVEKAVEVEKGRSDVLPVLMIEQRKRHTSVDVQNSRACRDNVKRSSGLVLTNEKRTESPFERDVLKRLLVAGYQAIPQWKVGSRRIDLVIEGNGRRLAVECDGDRYHLSSIEKRAEQIRNEWNAQESENGV